MADSTAQPVSAPSAQSGMLIMVLALFLVPVGDSLSKLLTGILGPFEIALWRFLFQTLVLAGALLVMRPKIIGGHFGWLILGGITSAATLAGLIGAFVVMPIATAIAIFFVEPLILTVLSAIILKEKTGWRRYLAVLVGLVGAIVVIRPGWDVFGWRTLLPLAAALAFALNAISMRKASEHLPSVSVQFWFALVAMVVLALSRLFLGELDLFSFANGFDTDGPWLQLLIMGALSALTFFLFSEAFRRTPAGTLAPFQYIEIIGATALGYFVFGDFPDLWTWIGTAIILASGLYVFHRERRTEPVPPPHA